MNSTINPTISIIIVNYRSGALVRETIKSFKCLHTALTYEIIVVDNEGDRKLQECIAERFGDVHYVALRRNLGLAVANNTGARVARGTYLLFSNPDITAMEGCLETLHDHLEKNPDIGIAGPRLLNPNGTVQQSYYHFYTPLTPLYRRLFLSRFAFAKKHLEHFLMRQEDMSQPRDVDLLMGACLFVRKSVLDDVGLMDENFFLYFEDVDWCKRFWNAGYRVVYIPQARMIHLHKRDSAQKTGIFSVFDRYTRIHIASSIRYFLKHWPHYARRKEHTS